MQPSRRQVAVVLLVFAASLVAPVVVQAEQAESTLSDKTAIVASAVTERLATARTLESQWTRARERCRQLEAQIKALDPSSEAREDSSADSGQASERLNAIKKDLSENEALLTLSRSNLEKLYVLIAADRLMVAQGSNPELKRLLAAQLEAASSAGPVWSRSAPSPSGKTAGTGVSTPPEPKKESKDDPLAALGWAVGDSGPTGGEAGGKRLPGTEATGGDAAGDARPSPKEADRKVKETDDSLATLPSSDEAGGKRLPGTEATGGDAAGDAQPSTATVVSEPKATDRKVKETDDSLATLGWAVDDQKPQGDSEPTTDETGGTTLPCIELEWLPLTEGEAGDSRGPGRGVHPSAGTTLPGEGQGGGATDRIRPPPLENAPKQWKPDPNGANLVGAAVGVIFGAALGGVAGAFLGGIVGVLAVELILKCVQHFVMAEPEATAAGPDAREPVWDDTAEDPPENIDQPEEPEGVAAEAAQIREQRTQVQQALSQALESQPIDRELVAQLQQQLRDLDSQLRSARRSSDIRQSGDD
ncbi:MAG: hypothetical protein HY814_08185 [Candidatus Riflebacteria bacterium]|nr:hypothetical protein [Candidatus Riflebacteria bacterium]